MTKVCTKCKIEKELSEFGKKSASHDGLRSGCKMCAAEHLRVYCAANKERLAARRREYDNKNAEKIAAYYREKRAADREGHREACRKYHSENKDKRVVYLLNNKERIDNCRREHYKKHPGKMVALTNKRRAAKLCRTPPWADPVLITLLYDAAKAFDFFNPFTAHHVDHVIPLRGDTVSGLHVHNNMQILTAGENLSKGNRFDA